MVEGMVGNLVFRCSCIAEGSCEQANPVLVYTIYLSPGQLLQYCLVLGFHVLGIVEIGHSVLVTTVHLLQSWKNRVGGTLRLLTQYFYMLDWHLYSETCPCDHLYSETRPLGYVPVGIHPFRK